MENVKKKNIIAAGYLGTIISMLVICVTLSSHFTRESARMDSYAEKFIIQGQQLNEIHDDISALKEQVSTIRENQSINNHCKQL